MLEVTHPEDVERSLTAIHEAGHALVGMNIPESDPVHKVTIVPRGRALGVTFFLPEADILGRTKEELLAMIANAMGGRIAEELFIGRITTGASNDIEKATEVARSMVCQYGMSDLGPLAFGVCGDLAIPTEGKGRGSRPGDRTGRLAMCSPSGVHMG